MSILNIVAVVGFAFVCYGLGYLDGHKAGCLRGYVDDLSKGDQP